MLNGRVKPPIVLYNDKEILVAQNAHNLVWEKYRQEFDEIEQAKDVNRMKDLNERAKAEIDELINREIPIYRANYSGSCPLTERISELEEKLEELTGELEDIRSIAEEAQAAAEEALENSDNKDGDEEVD